MSESSAKSYPQTFFEPPPGACQIVLVRHGQSAPYVEGQPFALVDGQGDPPLSPLGEYQALNVGERLRDEPITALYASTLTRTQQTAAPLAAHLGLDVHIDADLREVHLGIGEGGHFRRMSAEGHPQVAAMRANMEWGEVEGAETNTIFGTRTVGAVRRIATAHPDEMVAVFCHGGVIGALLGHAFGINMFQTMGSRNGAISHVVVPALTDQNQRWIVRSFNDAAHNGPLSEDRQPPA